MVSTPSSPRPNRPPAEVTELASCTVGAPCWANLATPDPRAPEDLYGAVIGLQVALDWTPYFCVTNTDEATARIVERTGTIAVGPVRLRLGRGVCFPAPNADIAAETASRHGDGTIGRAVAVDHRKAPHGAVFGVRSPRNSVIIAAAVGSGLAQLPIGPRGPVGLARSHRRKKFGEPATATRGPFQPERTWECLITT